MSDISIVSMNAQQFQVLSGNLRDIQIYDESKVPGASGLAKTDGYLAIKRLGEDFRYLLDMHCKLSEQPSRAEPDDPLFVCAIDLDAESARALVGFCAIRHISTDKLTASLLAHMKASGNRNLGKAGYDCVTAVSTYALYREQGIAGKMLSACADLIAGRHSNGGGTGPALMQISPFTPMGLKRLHPSLKKLAARRPDIVVGYDPENVRRLGEWESTKPAAKKTIQLSLSM